MYNNAIRGKKFISVAKFREKLIHESYDEYRLECDRLYFIKSGCGTMLRQTQMRFDRHLKRRKKILNEWGKPHRLIYSKQDRSLHDY